ncbi:hypothetical protein BJ508DRAFT_323432 [Ascobolus immersus RN42]|uniref:Uncharacterized protein n=1 Tax=Ascobolus immersus RN42 TaxID=1160509 RepID=A0A3N4IGG0_ASCIM|nr:hypothetical protein BJ508DRAFT_323432 [Ascobolus immersus RN42]
MPYVDEEEWYYCSKDEQGCGAYHDHPQNYIQSESEDSFSDSNSDSDSDEDLSDSRTASSKCDRVDRDPALVSDFPGRCHDEKGSENRYSTLKRWRKSPPAKDQLPGISLPSRSEEIVEENTADLEKSKVEHASCSGSGHPVWDLSQLQEWGYHLHGGASEPDIREDLWRRMKEWYGLCRSLNDLPVLQEYDNRLVFLADNGVYMSDTWECMQITLIAVDFWKAQKILMMGWKFQGASTVKKLDANPIIVTKASTFTSKISQQEKINPRFCGFPPSNMWARRSQHGYAPLYVKSTRMDEAKKVFLRARFY